MITDSTTDQAADNNESFGEVLNRNINSLIEVRRRQEKQKGMQDRISDAVTRFSGSMVFVYLHLLLFGSWIVINLGWIRIIKRFDPSFVVLAMFASVEAIFLSTFVLISQNRMAQAADKRAELDLQISLLAEHEITQVLVLVDAMAQQMNVQRQSVPQIEDAKHDIDPTQVLETIEERGKEIA